VQNLLDDSSWMAARLKPFPCLGMDGLGKWHVQQRGELRGWVARPRCAMSCHQSYRLWLWVWLFGPTSDGYRSLGVLKLLVSGQQ
jgi:hypothetical protein